MDPMIGDTLGGCIDDVVILTALDQILLLVSILAIDVPSRETISLNYEQCVNFIMLSFLGFQIHNACIWEPKS